MTKYLLFLIILSLAACEAIKKPFEFINEAREQAEEVEQRASVSGKVVNRSGRKGPVLAVLVQHVHSSARLVNVFHISANGAYNFSPAPGSYGVGAFVDVNSDDIYQLGEPATYLGADRAVPVTFTLGKKDEKRLPTLVIEGALDRILTTGIVDGTNKALKNTGRVVKLRDPMFSRENAQLGVWKPIEFLEKVGGGVFLLGKFRQDRIPVVFVHGIEGTPTDFKQVIKSLDRKKFQPIVFHYPSGLPLDEVSGFMLKALNKLYAKYRFTEFYVVAHSMGGLVTRDFVRKYEAAENPSRIGLVMTINSPMMGIESAAAGVKYLSYVDFMPVVPAWRDVAYDSEFIRELHSWLWPEEIPYHLVFSYLEDEASDGVVSLQSQIPRSLQREAAGMYGFEAEHAGLLKKREFTREFNRILLENYTGVKTDLAASD